MKLHLFLRAMNSWFQIGQEPDSPCAATPRSIVNQLHAALSSKLTQPDLRERLESRGSEAAGCTPEVFGMSIRDESEIWSRIIRDLQLTLD